MYVTAEIIRDVEQRYGIPVEIVRKYEMTSEQLGIVRLGQKHGRCHDVTLVVVDDERNIVVIRKPSYPLGAYRTPSGGIEVGESFDDGAIREAKEETGLDIVLEKYLIRANVRFRCGSEVIDWTTHVLRARPNGGTLQPIDTKEIVEARKVTIAEITGPIREALIATGSPGLRYRAELDGLAVKLIRNWRPFWNLPTSVVVGFHVLAIGHFLFFLLLPKWKQISVEETIIIVAWLAVSGLSLLALSGWELVCRWIARKRIRCRS